MSDDTTTCCYGNGRIAQTNTTTEYFLGDALGSVRQLSMTDGEISLAQSYDPYGNVTFTSGMGTSPFAYTGEQQDASGLTYLRARYYSPLDGRFLSRDTWSGDVNRPLSLNRWMYVEGNPVNLTDPTGYIAEGHDARTADVIRGKLRILYGVEIQKDWGYIRQYAPRGVALPTCVWNEGNWGSAEELYNVFNGVRATAKGMGSITKFRSAMKFQPVKIRRVNLDGDHTPHTLPFLDIVYFNYAITNRNYINFTTIHEFGHVWDIRTGFRLSSEMSRVVGSYYCNPYPTPACYYDWTKGQEDPPGDLNDPNGPYAGNNAREDWAESFAVYIDPHYQPSYFLGSIRKQYVQDKINAIP